MYSYIQGGVFPAEAPPTSLRLCDILKLIIKYTANTFYLITHIHYARVHPRWTMQKSTLVPLTAQNHHRPSASPASAREKEPQQTCAFAGLGKMAKKETCAYDAPGAKAWQCFPLPGPFQAAAEWPPATLLKNPPPPTPLRPWNARPRRERRRLLPELLAPPWPQSGRQPLAALPQQQPVLLVFW